MSVLNKGQRTCPVCGSNWDGGSIVETFLKQRQEGVSCWQGKSDKDIEDYVKEFYSEPYTWGREIGIELAWDHPNYYDGISYWQCPDCKSTFNRFTGEQEEIK